jgi:hypothetical protein
MEHAERCVRHFELIRRHERSRDGYGGASVDFRQLYFRTSHKLEVARAPEPSDIIWANLRYSRLHARTQNFKTSLIIFLVSCVSTIFITAATLVSNMYSRGLVTSLWSTPVIILSNVAIFVLVPLLAVHLEREHTRSSQQLHMLIKMVFFQLFNTVIATLSFLFMHWNEPPADTPSCPLAEHLTLARDEPCFTPSLTMPIFDPRCVKHWYTSGPDAGIVNSAGISTTRSGLPSTQPEPKAGLAGRFPGSPSGAPALAHAAIVAFSETVNLLSSLK